MSQIGSEPACSSSTQPRSVCATEDQPGAIELEKAFEADEEMSGTARETRPDKKRGGYTFEFIVKLRQEPR